METDHIASLLSSGEYSDLTIECQGKSFKVHRAIVCSQSPVVDAALRVQSKETQNIFKIDDFDADTVEHMIKFMYGIKRPFSAAADTRSAQEAAKEADTLPLESEKPSFKDTFKPVFEAEKKNMVARVNASRIAEYYNVSAMAKVVHEEMSHIFRTDWQEGTFVEALKAVPTSTENSDLFDVLAEAAAKHIEYITCHDDMAQMMANHNLAVKFISSIAERTDELKDALKTQVDLAKSQTELLASSKQVQEHMEQCLDNLYDIKSCRHCQAQFSCYIETQDHMSYTIRCSGCRTRH